MLTITFANGSMMFMNIASPHTIYMRTIEQTRVPMSQLNGMSNMVKSMLNGDDTDGIGSGCGLGTSGEITSPQLFAQSNGQIIDICNDRVAIKSVWEYFLEKISNT